MQTPVVLAAEGLTLEPYFRNVSFEAHAGEVLGVYGFMGCGQIELARMLFGKFKPERGAAAARRRRRAAEATPPPPRTPGSASCRKAGA